MGWGWCGGAAGEVRAAARGRGRVCLVDEAKPEPAPKPALYGCTLLTSSTTTSMACLVDEERGDGEDGEDDEHAAGHDDLGLEDACKAQGEAEE